MAGAEKIINDILLEAHSQADYIRTVAEEKADAILKKAEDESRTALEKAEKDAEKAEKEYEARIASSGEMNRKKAMLAGLDDAAYFEMLLKLLEKTAHSGDGVLCLSEKDLKRLPADFAQKAADTAKKAGGSLKISDTPEKISDGFILKYGGIEENCTLRALFDDKEEQLRDVVQSVLW